MARGTGFFRDGGQATTAFKNEGAHHLFMYHADASA